MKLYQLDEIIQEFQQKQSFITDCLTWDEFLRKEYVEEYDDNLNFAGYRKI